MAKREEGFTIIEVVVAIFIFSIVSVAFYQVLFSATRASNTTNDVVTISEEARLGFNRMVRDTREGAVVLAPSGSSYTVQIDFDSDGVIDAVPDDATGNYEELTFTFNPSATGNGTITVSNGVITETLVQGIDCIRKADNTCQDVFTYSSSRLEWDTNGDGVTSAAELNLAPTVGNGNCCLDGNEIEFVDQVAFAMTVAQGDSSTRFYAEAQLRNNR